MWSRRTFIGLGSILMLVLTSALVVTIAWDAGAFGEDEPEPALELAENADQQTVTPAPTADAPEWASEPPARRTTFSFCIDTFRLPETSGSAASAREDAKNAIGDAIASISGYDVWTNRLQAHLPGTFIEGCPQVPFPSVTSGEWIKGEYFGSYGEIDRQFNEETWSTYNFFVFVMPLSEIDDLLGGTSRRVAEQELERHGDVISTVSRGIYLTPEEIKENQPLIVETMEWALGLTYD